jgi:sugar/nucleoside kinase (ribokinase family)
MSLVIVGSLALDTIETPYRRVEKIVGGSCTYCALSASFFTKPGIVGVVGEDFPKETIDFLQRMRIDTRGLAVSEGKTFHWEGHYGSDPNQRTTKKLEMNVFQNFRPQLPPDYRDAEILFLANINPDLQEDILNQAKNPKLIALDTISHWIERKKDALVKVLERVDMFFCNDEEAYLLTGEENLVRAGQGIAGMGPATIVIKKGEHGVLVFSRDFLFEMLAYPCEKVVDATGAGDSFAGGFLGYLDKAGTLTEKDLRKASALGTVMAAFVIEDFGIQRFRSLKLQDIESRLDRFKRYVSF